MMSTEWFVFHDDLTQLLKECGMDVPENTTVKNKEENDETSVKQHWSLPISSRLDARVALACLVQVKDAKDQLEKIQKEKDLELADIHASAREVAAKLEEEYGRLLLEERNGKEQLAAQVTELQNRLNQLAATSKQHAKLQAKFERRRTQLNEWKRKVLHYERRIDQMEELGSLRIALSEQLDEWKGLVHSSIDLTETNRDLIRQVERVVTKLNNEAGRIHGVDVTPEGQLRGRVVKSDATSISIMATLSSSAATLSAAAASITPAPEEKMIECRHHQLTTSNRLFRRKGPTNKKSGVD